MPKRWDTRFRESYLLRILSLFALLALAYSAIVPFGEPTDEEAHFAYIEYLLSYRQLPVQSFDPTQNKVQEGHHPPGYYALVALLTGYAPYQPYHLDVNPYLPIGRDDFYIVQQFLHPAEEKFPWRGPLLAAHVARLVSIGMGVVGVWITYLIGKEIAPRSRWIPLLAAGTHAFVPQFIHISAAINNDNAAALMGSLITWQMLRLLRRADETFSSYGGFALLGLLMGIGILGKVSLLAMLLAVLWTVAYTAWQFHGIRPALKSVVLNTGLVLAPMAILTGWWIWRNLRLYGDPIAWNVWMANCAQFLRRLPLTWWYVLRFLEGQFCSFWALFGWGRVLLPTWLYLCLLALTSFGIGGLIRHFARSRRRDHGARIILLFLVFAGFLLSTWRLGLSQDTVAAQGRFLFPALSAIAVLLAVGWTAWWPPVMRGQVSRVLISSLFALSAGALIFRLFPVYVRPLRAALPQTARPVEADLGELWRLVGWQAPQPLVGQTWPVTLYWQAQRELSPEERSLSPTLYLRLVDVSGKVVAGWDGVPTRGRFPPPVWSPDVIVADFVRLKIHQDIEPRLSHLLVGFYFQEGRHIEPVSEPASLGPVLLRFSHPPSPDFDRAVEAQFGSHLRLLGFDLQPTLDGETMRVLLYWESEEEVALDYTVFVHLVGAQGLAAQGDAPPCGGGCPTSLWRPGDVWRDEHSVPVGGLTAADAPYTLSIGLYDSNTGERMPAFSAAGEEYAQDRVVLCTFASWPGGKCK